MLVHTELCGNFRMDKPFEVMQQEDLPRFFGNPANIRLDLSSVSMTDTMLSGEENPSVVSADCASVARI